MSHSTYLSVFVGQEEKNNKRNNNNNYTNFKQRQWNGFYCPANNDLSRMEWVYERGGENRGALDPI